PVARATVSIASARRCIRTRRIAGTDYPSPSPTSSEGHPVGLCPVGEGTESPRWTIRPSMSDPLRLDERYECGSVITAQERSTVLALARRAEAAGFDSLWAGDHVSFYIPILESLTLLSFVAAATERVKLGTAVYLVPLRHP